jgi:hypothetical protein
MSVSVGSEDALIVPSFHSETSIMSETPTETVPVDPNSKEAYNEKGNQLKTKGEHKKAIENYNLAI